MEAMTLHNRDRYSIPEETSRVAHRAFPKGNNYMTMRDKLDLWYRDSDYAHLFESHQGRPAESPGLLNLIIVMQFAEGLSDQQAADAVRSRIDWKYALGLALDDPGFDTSILSDHRQRLIAGSAEQQLLDDMLKQFRTHKLLRARGQQRTDSTHVLAAIRNVNRLELIGETMRQALNQIAEAAPDWLRSQVTPDWFDLYGPRFEQYRLPAKEAERQALAERIGADGYHVMTGIYSQAAPASLRQLPGVEILRRVWLQQFMLEADQVRWRSLDNQPPAETKIVSPYDIDARYGKKRQTEWVGYKVHLTETCDPDVPHLITQVETATAPIADGQALDDIHAALAEKDLLPATHLIDNAYVDADAIVDSRPQGIELLGPVRPDHSWQAKAHQGFDLAAFAIAWDAQTVTCPGGQTNLTWRPIQDRTGNAVIEVRFDPRLCRTCAFRSQCTHSENHGRCLSLKPQAQHAALQDRRAYQTTEDFKRRYAKRAGIEGRLSQGVRAFDLRTTRYIGLAKTHLQHILTAAAMNLTSAVAWLHGDVRASTRRSSFAALAAVT
jgi:transposase